METPVEYVVKTFLESKTKKLNQVVVGIQVNKGNSLPLPVLIDDEFDMNLRFDNFKSVKNNLLNLNYKLAFLHEKNDIRVNGLLGIDVIQFMKNIKMVDCMKGSAWEFPTGIFSLGNCQHFLYENQSTPKKVQSKDFQRNYHAIVSKFSTCSDTRGNFVMNPIKSYPDPFAEIFVESQVERNLEKMFDVDSLGTSSEDEAICDYDQHKIMEFEKIHFDSSLNTNGKYSLNEAAYPDINLMGDMLDLLLLFRSNKYVMLASDCLAS